MAGEMNRQSVLRVVQPPFRHYILLLSICTGICRIRSRRHRWWKKTPTKPAVRLPWTLLLLLELFAPQVAVDELNTPTWWLVDENVQQNPREIIFLGWHSAYYYSYGNLRYTEVRRDTSWMVVELQIKKKKQQSYCWMENQGMQNLWFALHI